VRTRAKITGNASSPRLSVFRSNKYIYAQLINDEKGVTLVAASSRDLKTKSGTKKAEEAFRVGEMLADRAKEKGIVKAIFDRGSYLFHGRVKALAEGARKGGLSF